MGLERCHQQQDELDEPSGSRFVALPDSRRLMAILQDAFRGYRTSQARFGSRIPNSLRVSGGQLKQGVGNALRDFMRRKGVPHELVEPAIELVLERLPWDRLVSSLRSQEGYFWMLGWSIDQNIYLRNCVAAFLQEFFRSALSEVDRNWGALLNDRSNAELSVEAAAVVFSLGPPGNPLNILFCLASIAAFVARTREDLALGINYLRNPERALDEAMSALHAILQSIFSEHNDGIAKATRLGEVLGISQADRVRDALFPDPGNCVVQDWFGNVPSDIVTLLEALGLESAAQFIRALLTPFTLGFVFGPICLDLVLTAVSYGATATEELAQLLPRLLNRLEKMAIALEELSLVSAPATGQHVLHSGFPWLPRNIATAVQRMRHPPHARLLRELSRLHDQFGFDIFDPETLNQLNRIFHWINRKTLSSLPLQEVLARSAQGEFRQLYRFSKKGPRGGPDVVSLRILEPRPGQRSPDFMVTRRVAVRLVHEYVEVRTETEMVWGAIDWAGWRSGTRLPTIENAGAKIIGGQISNSQPGHVVFHFPYYNEISPPLSEFIPAWDAVIDAVRRANDGHLPRYMKSIEVTTGTGVVIRYEGRNARRMIGRVGTASVL